MVASHGRTYDIPSLLPPPVPVATGYTKSHTRFNEQYGIWSRKVSNVKEEVSIKVFMGHVPPGKRIIKLIGVSNDAQGLSMCSHVNHRMWLKVSARLMRTSEETTFIDGATRFCKCHGCSTHADTMYQSRTQHSKVPIFMHPSLARPFSGLQNCAMQSGTSFASHVVVIPANLSSRLTKSS